MTPDPLIPPVYDVLWAVIPVIVLAAVILALVSILRAPTLSPGARVGWTVVVVVLPVLGPLLWFLGPRRFDRSS